MAGGASEPLPEPVSASVPADTPLLTSYNFTNRYPSLSEYYGWYDHLVNSYTLPEPHKGLVSKMNIGKSWEGRDMWVLNITSDEDTVVGYKPGVFINGNIHAREWSTSQASAYLAWYLLENYETNDTIHWLLNNRRVYIMPMSNPDGYVYDGEGNWPSYLGWRKNRNDTTPTTAVGVDLNRNWDVDWVNGVDDPYDDTYHGEYAFSENETKAMRNFIINTGIDSFQDIHTFAGTLLIPLCYSTTPSVHDEWYRGTTARMTSFTTRLGTPNTYTYGQPIQTIGYAAPGGSIDWTYEALGIQSYCFELYTGTALDITGFYPNPSLIMTINQDVDDALIYQARVADVDLGDGTDLLFPPVPYIVYGTVMGPGDVLRGTSVTVTNTATGETITINTDSNGYYELNLGTMTQFGYQYSDVFTVSSGPYSVEFSAGSEWGRRIDVNTVATNVPITVDHFGPGNSTGTFSLYPRGVPGEVTVNGLTANSLSKVQSSAISYYHTSPTLSVSTYTGIRAWRRSQAGVETEITSGTAVAVASRTVVGEGLRNATYTPPVTTLSDGDSLVLRLYAATSAAGLTVPRAVFITEPMGPGTLQANQWTVSYYIRMNQYRSGGLSGSYVAWGATMFNTSITNFRYSAVSIPWHHNTVNWTDAGAGVTQYLVYRSDAVSGIYELLGSVPAGTYTSLDRRMGLADSTYWWYRVLAVGLDGRGFIAEQEPGGTETGYATATGPTGGPSTQPDISVTYFWTGTPTSVYLYYTLNGGTTWTQLAQLSGSGITGSYSWPLPASGEYGWFASAQGDGSTDPVPPASGTWPQALYIYDVTPPDAPTQLTVERFGPDRYYETQTENRFMLDTQSTVNGLSAYNLGTVQTATGVTNGDQRTGGTGQSVTWGIRAWKRASGGTETEITAGSMAATVQRTANGNGLQSATWSCPGSPLATTDSIVVRVYVQVGTNPVTLLATFTNPQLGATQVDVGTWTAYYYTARSTGGGGSNAWTRGDYSWGTATYNSRITDFTYSIEVPGDPTWHNTLNWTASLSQDVSHYNIYRAETEAGPYTLIDMAPAGTNYYVDMYMGSYDTTNWWYIVRAEDFAGNEEQNSNAMPESIPGPPYSINLAGRTAGDWVLVSYPVSVTGDIGAVLPDEAGGTQWDVAKSWDAQTQSWKSYRRGATTNTFTQVTNHMGVWLHLTANAGDQALTLGSVGAMPGTVQITLYAGWNLVGYPSGTQRDAATVLTGTGADMISVYTSTTPYIQDRTDLANVQMHDGSAYWVHVPATTTWNVAP